MILETEKKRDTMQEMDQTNHCREREADRETEQSNYLSEIEK